jgi:hypothetical protein
VTFASFSKKGDLILQRDTMGQSITEKITLDKLKEAWPSSLINKSN